MDSTSLTVLVVFGLFAVAAYEIKRKIKAAASAVAQDPRGKAIVYGALEWLIRSRLK